MGLFLTNNEVDLARTIISWPMVGLIILLLLFVYRAKAWEAVTKFLENRRVKLPWAEISEPVARSSKAAQTKRPTSQKKPPRIPPVIAKEYEDAISSRDKKVSTLEKTIADFYAALDFERTYNILFGTQLAILIFLRANPSSAITETELGPFFEQHRMLAREGGFPDVHKLMSYLIFKGLVSLVAGKYFITEKGRAFLGYIEQQNYSLAKTG